MEQEGVSIKVAGALKGAVRVASFDVTAGELRAEVSRLLGEQVRLAAGHTAWLPMHSTCTWLQHHLTAAYGDSAGVGDHSSIKMIAGGRNLLVRM
jgi:hypothetical protein